MSGRKRRGKRQPAGTSASKLAMTLRSATKSGEARVHSSTSKGGGSSESQEKGDSNPESDTSDSTGDLTHVVEKGLSLPSPNTDPRTGTDTGTFGDLNSSDPNLKPPDLNTPSPDLGLLEDKQKSHRSYSAVVAGIRLTQYGVRLHRVEGVNEDLVEISNKDIRESCLHWESALVRLIPGARVSFQAMDRFVVGRWSDVSKPKTMENRDAVFLFRFRSSSDAYKILEAGPWMFGGTRPILLKCGTPGMKLSPNTFKFLPLWVSLPDLDIRTFLDSTGPMQDWY